MNSNLLAVVNECLNRNDNKLNLMTKSKLLHVAFFMCLCSFAMNAQAYLSGDLASEALQLEASTLKTQIENAMSAGNFQNDEEYVQQNSDAAISFLMLNVLTDFPVQSGDSSSDVKSSFENVITVISSSASYTPSQVVAIEAKLKDLITQ